jgi:hypothetical protein
MARPTQEQVEAEIALIVLDPFAGSGTTLIAAEKTGRSARLIEFDPIYCDRIVGRFEKLTDQLGGVSCGGGAGQAERARRATAGPVLLDAVNRFICLSSSSSCG